MDYSSITKLFYIYSKIKPQIYEKGIAKA